MMRVLWSLRAGLQRLLFDHDRIAGLRFDVALQAVIFVSLAGPTLESWSRSTACRCWHTGCC